MLNIHLIPHVLRMDVVVPMTKGTNRHMFPSAPRVRDSHAGNNIVSHGSKSHHNKQHGVAMCGTMLL